MASTMTSSHEQCSTSHHALTIEDQHDSELSVAIKSGKDLNP